jgi:hypothetical protein
VRTLAMLLFAATAASLTNVAFAQEFAINTGGRNGAYHREFCPVLSERLKEAGFTSECRTSAGTTENMQRVTEDPAHIGYGQLDVLALKAPEFGGASNFRRLRTDDVRECIFAVTGDKGITSYGDIAVRADELRIVLPPEKSGSAATFRYLQSVDPYGVGRANDIIYSANTDEAIRIALNSDRTVALFVQFPDPDNPRFQLVRDMEGHIVPVIDRTILDQKIDGMPVYFAQETQVENAGWLSTGAKLVTACTPLVVFTGQSYAIKDPALRDSHERMAAIVERLRGDTLMPLASVFARVLKRTRELTASGAEKFVSISEKARAKAAPLFEKAREAARQAVQGAHGNEPGAPETGEPKNGRAPETGIPAQVPKELPD